MSALSENFTHDRENLLLEVKSYLYVKPIKKTADTLKKEALDLLKKGKFEQALQKLEIARDARNGIISSIQRGNVLIRDARNYVPANRGAEAFLMQFVNSISAANEVAEISGIKNLGANLLAKATSFFDKLKFGMTQEKMADVLRKELGDLVLFLERNGVKDAAEKLNLARDFQCFGRSHFDIATISAVQGSDGKMRNVVEAEVAFKELTGQQHQQLTELESNKKIPEFERKLMRKHHDAIVDGTHVIPARKHSLPGVSLFEKITLLDNGKGLEEVLSSYHSATVSSLCADKNLRDKMTRQNIAQVRESIGSDIHLNLLNAKKRPRFLGGKDDPELVNRTEKAAKYGKKSKGNPHASVTTTCVNGFRYFGASSDLSDAKRYLSKISKAINPQDAAFIYGQSKSQTEIAKILRDVQRHISPPSVLDSVRKIFPPYADKAIKALNKIKLTNALEVREILKEAVDLAQKVAKADRVLRLGDGENVSLDVAASLNRLSYLVEKLREKNPQAPGIDVSELPKERVVTACTHGRDRTGIKTNEESARVIAKKLAIDVCEVDEKLTASSSAGHMAGSAMAGFNLAGNFGIKKENRFVFPSGRKAVLSDVIEKSAQGSEIKKPSIFSRIGKSSPKEIIIIPDKTYYREEEVEQHPSKNPDRRGAPSPSFSNHGGARFYDPAKGRVAPTTH